MRAQVHGHNQRLHLLEDQLATASKAIASHSINEPDFRDRKEELERLTAKIAALRQVKAIATIVLLLLSVSWFPIRTNRSGIYSAKQLIGYILGTHSLYA